MLLIGTPAGFIVRSRTYRSTAEIYWAYCEFKKENFNPSLFSHFSIAFPPQLEKAVPKRCAEFLAGRIAATRALARLGCPNHPVPIGKHREPVWPEGVVGAISHSGSRALCAVSWKIDNGYLGIDMESLVSEDTAGKIGCFVFREEEESLLLQAGHPKNVAFTLAFSAKESLFKALYPRIGKYFDFECARVVEAPDGKCFIVLELDRDLARTSGLKRRYRCDFKWSEGVILTVIAGSF